MASRHSPDKLAVNRQYGPTPTSGWHRGIRTLLILLVLAVALLSGQPNAESMPEGPARPAADLSTRFEGVVRDIKPDRWMVGQIAVQLDPQTVLIEKRGKAQIGAWVIVWGQQSEAGSLRAEVIKVDRPTGWAGPVDEISGMLRKQTAQWWVVEQQLIEITAETVIIGEPRVGALVWVVATRQGDTWRALAAEVLAANVETPPVEFEGVIQYIGSTTWRVDGHQIIIDRNTDIIGEPLVGRIAEVRATQLPNGNLLAQVIRVVDRAAEANLNAIVAEITDTADGDQLWEVIVFPKSPWANPVVGTLHVGGNTYVDESRATVQIGQWVEVRGVNLGGDQYQADIIRMERPVPINLTGEIQPAPGDGWGQINGQPVWLGAVQPGGAAAQAIAGDNVAVIGVRLGNGVIWAKQVHRVEP